MTHEPTPERTGLFHSVYFWMREGGDPGDAARVIAGCEQLRSIPGVLRLTVGTPAATAGGSVDASYGVALLIEFADVAAHDVYNGHPDHRRFIAECGPLCRRVQVYDAAPSPGRP